jgi:hypothetical protein
MPAFRRCPALEWVLVVRRSSRASKPALTCGAALGSRTPDLCVTRQGESRSPAFEAGQPAGQERGRADTEPLWTTSNCYPNCSRDVGAVISLGTSVMSLDQASDLASRADRH